MELGLLAPGRENLCGGGVHPARGSHLSSLRLCLSYLALSLLYVFSCIKYFLLTFKSLTVMSNSCNPMDCSLPCSSVHGILQARVLEWVAISFCFHFLTLRLFVCFGSLGFPGGASGKDYPGKGNVNPLQYPCLETPMNRGAWQATVHGVARVGHDLASKPPPINT